MSFITVTELDELLEANWDRFCFISYEGFLKEGRGILAIGKMGEEVKVFYQAITAGRITDPKELEMAHTYDPEKSLLVQIMTGPGQSKTMRIDITNEDHYPKTIYKKFNVGKSTNF